VKPKATAKVVETKARKEAEEKARKEAEEKAKPAPAPTKAKPKTKEKPKEEDFDSVMAELGTAPTSAPASAPVSAPKKKKTVAEFKDEKLRSDFEKWKSEYGVALKNEAIDLLKQTLKEEKGTTFEGLKKDLVIDLNRHPENGTMAELIRRSMKTIGGPRRMLDNPYTYEYANGVTKEEISDIVATIKKDDLWTSFQL